MQEKRKLYNGAETIAVTSFLSLTYKPIKPVYAFDDYQFPATFLSVKGKLDTSRKFIHVGGANKKYLSNNVYGDYGSYLKKTHMKANSIRNSLRPRDGHSTNLDSHDTQKVDNGQEVVEFSPKIRKEFRYKKDPIELVNRQQQTLEFFKRTDAEGIKIIQKNKKRLEKIKKNESKKWAQDDDSDDEIGFWAEPERIPVQGFDEKTKQFRVEQIIYRFNNLNPEDTPINQSVTPSTPDLNERNQLAHIIQENLTKLEQEIVDLKVFQNKVNALLHPKIQGGTISSFGKMNQIIDVAHKELVENDTLKNTSQMVSTFNTVGSSLQSIVNAVLGLIDGIKAYIDQVLTTISSLSPSITIFLEIVGKALLLHFSSHFISRMCFGIDLSFTDLLTVFSSVVVARIFVKEQSWTETFISSLLFIFGNVLAHKTTDRLNVEGKDLYMIPFSLCMGMGLLASGRHSFCENFMGSIKSFGGILAFSNKCDGVLRSIADIIPNVMVEYFKYFCPSIYEYAILGWKDLDFQKDLEEIVKLISEPDSIYYSSHNTKKFLDLFARFKDIYVHKYGHFSFFTTSSIFDKIDCIHGEIKRRGLVPGKRHCPFVVWISGDSGVGKSTLAQYLAQKMIDPDIDYAKQVYTWNPVLEFQDGYNNQPVVIINDYMQTTDHGEEQLLISMKDGCDWMLNSSSTDDIINGKKGEMRFTSKLVIITSNMTYLHSSNYIRDTGAFNRRRDLLIEMRFKGGKKFDFEKTDYSWCSFASKDPSIDGLKSYDPVKDVNALCFMIERNYQAHYNRSLTRIVQGLKIQSDDETFEDALSPGDLKSAIISKIKEYKLTLKNLVKDHYKSILFGVTIFGVAALTLVKFLSKLPSTQAFNSGDSNTLIKMHPKVMQRFKSQAETINHDDQQYSFIEKNLFRVSTCLLVDNVSTIRSVTGIYIGNDKMLLPKHLFGRGSVKISPGDMIIINKGNIIYETTFEQYRLSEASEDYCFYDVSLIMPRLKNICHLFDNGLEPMDKQIDVTILRLDSNGDKVDKILTNAIFVNSVTCYDDVTNYSKEYVGRNMLRSRAGLQYGDCGAIITMRVGGNVRIFGIHVGGLGGVNYFQLTNVTAFSSKVQRVIPIKGFVESIDYTHEYGQFLIQGKVDSASFPYCNNTSKISPSMCYEVLQPHTTEPAVLSISDPRNPQKRSMLHDGTMALGKLVKPINSTNFDEILQYMRIRHQCLYGDYPILSLEEAINGIDGLDRLDFTTSPGYPYTVSSQGVSFRKSDFFKFDGKKWIPTEVFLQEYENFIELSKKQGIPIIWTNCVKDERRPIDKILKSRIFTISNIMLTVLGRQIFGTYVKKYSQYRHQHGGMIGINPYSSEWSILYDYLNEFESANDGDFSKFDKDLLKEIFQLFCRFVKEIIPNEKLYGKDIHWWIDEIMYCVLFSDTLTIIDGIKVLITTLHANPSGWFLTVFFNDFANKVYIYSVWQKIFKYILPEINKRIQAFMDNVRDAYFGDDNLYTVSKLYKDQFNAKIIAEQLMEMYGITYTSGDKGNVVSYNKPLKECTFLKNHFIESDGCIVAGLDKNTIQEMVSWTKDNDKSMQQILETSLRYSFFWGREYFNSNRSKLAKFETRLPSYEQLDYEFKYNGGLNFEIYKKQEEDKYLQLLHKINITKQKMDNKRQLNTIVEENGVQTVSSQSQMIKVQSRDRENVIRVQSKDLTSGLRDEDNVPPIVSNFGVSMVNQNINTDTHYFNQPAKVDIPESTSNLKKLLSRPILVVNQSISPGTFGTVASISFPEAWAVASKVIAEISQAYFLFKGKVKIQAVLQSTPFNAGTMVCHVSYKENTAFTLGQLESIYNAWLRPHIELDYSDNAANKVMDVPWKYKREYLEFDAFSEDQLCEIYFSNYIPNTHQARLLVYMWVEDAEVVITRPQIQGITLFGDTITNVSTSQNVGTVEGHIMPANIIGDQFDTEVSPHLSALDQPNLPINAMSAKIRREGTTSNAQQIQQMERLSLYPSEQQLCDFDTFGINEDEMSIDYLKRKWTIGGMCTPGNNLIKYSTSTNMYDVLAAGCVGPFGSSSFFVRETSSTPVFTFLDYISKGHALWRGHRNEDGAMEYRFKFACNRFQSGRVAVAYNPYATWQEMFGTTAKDGITFNKDSLGSCYVAYFDINGQNNEIVVRTPYISATPWKSIWFGYPDLDQPRILKDTWRNSFCGVIALIAISPLVSPEGSSTEINCVSFVRGAPGFEIACPCIKNNSIPIYSSFRVVSKQQDEEEEEDYEEETTTKPLPTLSTNKILIDKLKSTDKVPVQSTTVVKKIKVDCWEILRQIIRIPKVEFELPYYATENKNDNYERVESKDFIFLGDKIEKYQQDNSIKPTTSLRDLCKRFSQVYYGGGQMIINQMFFDNDDFAGQTFSNNFLRASRCFYIPLIPEIYTPTSGQIVLPAWYQQFGLYQGFRGGMKFRFRINVNRLALSLDDQIMTPNKNTRPFHVMVYLDDSFIGATVYQNGTFGNMAYKLPDLLLRYLGSSASNVNSEACHDLGLLAMESIINEEVDLEVEVPVHLFNKYHEMFGQAGNQINFSECRPHLCVFIYQDLVVNNPTDKPISQIIQTKEFKSMNSDLQVTMEVFQSFADDARCGILDEYPNLLSIGTDVYLKPESRIRNLPQVVIPYASV